MAWESWLEPPEGFENPDCDCGCDAWDECVCDVDEGCGSCGAKRGCVCDDMYDQWRDEQL